MKGRDQGGEIASTVSATAAAPLLPLPLLLQLLQDLDQAEPARGAGVSGEQIFSPSCSVTNVMTETLR